MAWEMMCVWMGRFAMKAFGEIKALVEGPDDDLCSLSANGEKETLCKYLEPNVQRVSYWSSDAAAPVMISTNSPVMTA